MFVKKLGSRIYGAELTSAERKALDIEIKKELAEYDEKHAYEMDAIILWHLHKELGFGKKRLERFYRAFAPAYRELIKRYELDDSEGPWLCTRKLKEETGVDMEKLTKELKEEL